MAANTRTWRLIKQLIVFISCTHAKNSVFLSSNITDTADDKYVTFTYSFPHTFNYLSIIRTVYGTKLLENNDGCYYNLIRSNEYYRSMQLYNLTGNIAQIKRPRFMAKSGTFTGWFESFILESCKQGKT